MKNYTLMAMTIAATLLTACNNDDKEQTDVTPVKAEFIAGIHSSQNRAAGTSWDATDEIGITASTAGYANVKYTPAEAGAEKAFNTQNTYYFVGTENVTFTAYYPFAGTEGTATAKIEKTITADMQTADGQKTIDFLFASATGSRSSATMQLGFDHKMSNLKLVFKAGSDVTLNTLSYTLSGLKMKGSFTTADGTATTDADANAADLTISNVAKPATGDMISSLILFPQEASSATLSVTLGGEIFTAKMTFPTENTKAGLASGTTYTYEVTVTKSALTVSKATINLWKDYTWSNGEGNIDANL